MFFNEILKIVEHLDLLFMLHTIFAKTIVAKNCEKGKIFSKLLSTRSYKTSMCISNKFISLNDEYFMHTFLLVHMF